jgi:hypothetical protein
MFSNYEVLYIKSGYNYKEGEIYDNTDINSRFDIFHGLLIEAISFSYNDYQALYFDAQDWLDRKRGKEFELPKHKDYFQKIKNPVKYY